VIECDFQHGRAAPEPPEHTHTHSEAHHEDLQEALTGLAGIVVGALTVGELLTRVAEFAAHAIPGVDGAGATVAHPTWARSRIQASAVAADFLRDIDTIQYEVHGEGPCITAMQTRRPCISGSIGDDRRWPRFGPAVARRGVHSALSLPLMLHDQVIGSISAYSHGRDAFAEHAVTMGAKFAGPAAVSVHNARILLEAQHRVEQLQRASGWPIGRRPGEMRSARWSRSANPSTPSCTSSPNG
jgi:GAF domain-containing protein